MKYRYSVNPTYSAGSPAQVDEQTARRVAQQEQDDRQRRLDGYYGPDAQRYARQRGLSGIVYCWCERGAKVLVEDLLTGEQLTFVNFPAFRLWGAQNRAWSRSDSVEFVQLTRFGLARVLNGVVGMSLMVDHRTDGTVHARDYRLLPGTQQLGREFSVWVLHPGDWTVL